MNELIKELWQQATPIDESRIVGGFYHPYIALQIAGEPTRHTFTEQELEKFAEVIVRECDKYVSERWDVCEPWMNPGDLLKHFGVEE